MRSRANEFRKEYFKKTTYLTHCYANINYVFVGIAMGDDNIGFKGATVKIGNETHAANADNSRSNEVDVALDKSYKKGTKYKVTFIFEDFNFTQTFKVKARL